MSARALRHLLIAVGLVALEAPLARAVLVSPLAVFMDPQTRTSEVTLANPSPTTEEVTIEVRYGIPTTDSLTELPILPTFASDSVAASVPSAARFLRVFPRRVVLQPGQSQVVRVFASPPPGLADGEYWARFMATSRQLADTGARAGGAVGISFAIVTSIPIWYRKGPVRTSLTLDSLSATVARDTLEARFVATRGGNASWLGTATFTLTDARGRVAREWPLTTGVFPTSLRRRLRWPLEQLPAGTYTLTASFRAARDDLKAGEVLSAPEARRTTTVTLP
ncbi:MAG: hypothetical protein HY275_03105 [Gemmatimonadetes bacterium]|nr:hypothetical protein [Gemmatimonadota bacterium]